MTKKARMIIGIIVSALFLINSLVQAVSLIIASDPPEMIKGLFGSDGETAAILMMFLIGLIVVWIVTFVPSLLQCLSALIGRIPGLVMSPIGIVLSAVFVCLDTSVFGFVTTSDNDLIIGGTLLFVVSSGWMCILSIANFVYVLVEFCIYKNSYIKVEEKRD